MNNLIYYKYNHKEISTSHQEGYMDQELRKLNQLPKYRPKDC